MSGQIIMGSIKWYKRDPRAALTGMMELNLEERGAYCTILELIYCHDGALEDDEILIASWLRVDLRVWRRLRATLLSRGKLYIHAGCLRNPRADDETRAVQHRVLSSVKANDKRWATYREIKALHDPVGLLSTSTKKESLSAKIMPIGKKDWRER
jgi:uncharacterized protein YdaU (DUF1376 family)